MDVGKQLLEQLVKQKCGHRTVKVILERILVSGQKPTNFHDHETRSSLEIIPENQVTSLRDSGKSSTGCRLELNRPQRNKTKIYTHFFKGGTESGKDDDGDTGSDASGPDSELEDSSDSDFDSTPLSKKTQRKPRNSRKTSSNLDHSGNNSHQNNAHSSATTKKRKPAEPKTACIICNLNISKNHMGRHFKRKHPHEKLPPPQKRKLAGIPCHFCRLIFSKPNLWKHLKIKHPEQLSKDNIPLKIKCDLGSLVLLDKGKFNKYKRTQHSTTRCLQCDLCSYKCTTQKGLENHILEVHVVDKPFECEICFKSFLTENLLHNHFRRAHESRNFNCRYCPTKFFKDSTSLKEHIVTVHKGYSDGHCDSEAASCLNNYLCPICDTWFLTDADMVAHLNTPKIKSEIKCEICSEPVRTPCLLIVHRQKMHGKIQLISGNFSNLPSQAKAIVESPDTKHRPYSEKITQIPSSVKNQVSSKKFSCVVCSAVSSRRSDLDLHELQENHRRWKCPICAKLLRTKTVLRIHTQSVHSNSKPFECTHQGCSKSFKLKHGLKRHMTLMHDIDLYPKDDWKFRCDNCSQIFGTSQNLKQHRLTHTEDRPWPCKFCDATYKCSSEAGRHMKKCQVRSEDQRKKYSRFSKASLEAAEKKKCDLLISGGRKKSIDHQDVKIHEKLKGKLKSTSPTNELTCATTTSCLIAGARNGNDVKLIKQEIQLDNFSDNSVDFDDRLLLPGGESVAKLEIVPKQEI